MTLTLLSCKPKPHPSGTGACDLSFCDSVWTSGSGGCGVREQVTVSRTVTSVQSLLSLILVQKTCCSCEAFLRERCESFLMLCTGLCPGRRERCQGAGGWRGLWEVCVGAAGGGHDAATVAAGGPACRGHLFTMENLPPGAGDLGQGSLDRPLESSTGQWLWRNAGPSFSFFLSFFSLSFILPPPSPHPLKLLFSASV